MKGTIDATRPDAEKELMENKKEAAEHATIVDLIRNDLSMIAEKVQVKRYRYVDHLTTNKGEILRQVRRLLDNSLLIIVRISVHFSSVCSLLAQ